MSREAEESPSARRSQADCADVVLRLFEYVDNEASDDDCRRIQAHLDECGSCLREYEKDVLLKAMVRRACGCEPAPDALRAQIMTRISGLSVTSFRGEQVSYRTEEISYRTEWREERW
ncbi:mycothiol system anti-sigma-R factor [Ornithinicoccus halotolerans]|uniref:mycothiol system anti-sigma-R factor n=1 Tax=Ornithinicoccus halotolerans TaxID=1748220 RepID=UPI0012950535|nr:mycothiol system anti-sigma-R factor [Ornithinicoccus halotolerans]